jgi:hypothetical protein
MLADFIKGLQLIQSVDPTASTSAEHDIIYITSQNENLKTKEGWTENIRDQLGNLGFCWDDEYDCWYYFT